MGTFTAPTGNAPRLFSNTSKLPFHSSTAGPAGAGTQSNTGTNLGSMSQTMLLLTANRSQEDIHNYEVPPTVKTGLDAVKLFASSAAKDGLIVFCNLNPASTVGMHVLCMCDCTVHHVTLPASYLAVRGLLRPAAHH